MAGGRPKGYPKSGGRTKGGINKTTLQKMLPPPDVAGVPLERIKSKPTPLAVMLDNMEWAVDQAMQTMDEELHRGYRALANSFAKDAAPYIHPKLVATAPAPVDQDAVKTIDHEPYRGRFDRVLEVFKSFQGEPVGNG